jgi:hypothetical protein
MKRFISSALVLASVATLGSGCLSAQSGAVLRVVVPFEFVAGARTLPAGTYRVKPSHDQRSVTIQGETNKLSTLILARPEGTNEWAETALTFHQYGDKHFLSQLFVYGAPVAISLVRSSTETKEIAAKSQMTNIRLLAKR